MTHSSKYQKIEQGNGSESEEEEGEVDEKSDATKSEWTPRRKIFACASCLINLLVFGVVSLIMPYFPTVGVRRGINKTVIGLIFSVCPLVGTFVSLMTGKMLQVLGYRPLLIGGLLLAAVFQVVFGFGLMIASRTLFIALCFICRILTAFGSVASYTTILAFVGQEFTTNYAVVFGLSEVFTGMGLAGAPTMGGIIYQYGGYIWPTVTMGLMLFVTAVLLAILFRDVEFQGSGEDSSDLLEWAFKLLKNAKVFIGVESALISQILLSLLEPIFAIFAKQVLRLNAQEIGLTYAALWLAYLPSSLLVGLLVDKIEHHLILMATGFAMSAFGLLILGPAPFLEAILPVGAVWLTILGEVLIGLGIALSFIPALPFVFKSVREDGIETDVIISSLLVGMFTCAVNAGAFLGPTLAGIIADYVDIRTDFMIFGLILAAQAGLVAAFALFNRCVTRGGSQLKHLKS